MNEKCFKKLKKFMLNHFAISLECQVLSEFPENVKGFSLF